jgi:type I restriction enzyme, S subunit
MLCETTLGKILSPRREKGLPSESPDLPFIGLEHIEAHTMRLLGTVPASTMRSNANRFYPGDVLYGRLRPYLNKVYIPSFGGYCSGEFIVFPKTVGVIPDFLKYRLNAADFVSFASHLNAGDRPRVDFKQISSFAFFLPSYFEQHRIVAKIEELFSSLDKGIENLKTALQQLKVYRQAVLKWAFEGRLTNKNVVDGELPEGWKYLKLKNITLENGGLRRGPFGSAIKKEFFVLSGYKVYEQGNAINDDPYRGHYFITESKYNELENFRVVPGDLIVSCSGVTLGKISEIPNDAQPGVINQALLRIKLKNDLISNNFFILYFRSSFFQKIIFDQSQGTAMPNLVGIKDFKEIKLLVPPLPEQNTIVAEIDSRLSVCDRIEETINESLKQAEALRQSILKKAFEGKLVPQDANDEPASVLLDRIKAEKESKKMESSRARQPRKKRPNHEEQLGTTAALPPLP